MERDELELKDRCMDELFSLFISVSSNYTLREIHFTSLHHAIIIIINIRRIRRTTGSKDTRRLNRNSLTRRIIVTIRITRRVFYACVLFLVLV